MLVHKGTMGVLDEIWTGRYRKGPDGGLVPLCREARLADFPELDPAQWWEVPRTSPLGKRIRRYYPLLRPVTGHGGELLDAVIVRPDGELAACEARKREALRRGYKQAGRVRAQGVMGFLCCTQTYPKQAETRQGQTGRSGRNRKGGFL